MAVVEQTVEDRGRDHGIVEDRAPLAHATVAGHQDAAPLVAAADQGEEQVRGVRLERQGAELVHDQQDRKSTRLNSSHANISYAVFCLKKKNKQSRCRSNVCSAYAL